MPVLKHMKKVFKIQLHHLVMAINKINIAPMFHPLRIKTNSPKEIFNTHKLKLAQKVTEGVLHCIKYSKPKIVFAEIVIPNSMEIVSLNVSEASFMETLDKNLETLEEFEEYEWCAEIMKAKEKLLKGLPKKSTKKKKSEATEGLIGAIKNL
jgi:hypothetical protein